MQDLRSGLVHAEIGAFRWSLNHVHFAVYHFQPLTMSRTQIVFFHPQNGCYESGIWLDPEDFDRWNKRDHKKEYKLCKRTITHDKDLNLDLTDAEIKRRNRDVEKYMPLVNKIAYERNDPNDTTYTVAELQSALFEALTISCGKTSSKKRGRRY